MELAVVQPHQPEQLVDLHVRPRSRRAVRDLLRRAHVQPEECLPQWAVARKRQRRSAALVRRQPHARRSAIRSSATRTHARTRACSVPSCAHIRADAGSSGRLERSEHALLEHVQHIVRHMPCHVSFDTAWRRVTSNARYTLESRGTSCSLNTSTRVCHRVPVARCTPRVSHCMLYSTMSHCAFAHAQ